jgi:hypothetical protein
MACVVNPDGTITCPDMTAGQKAAIADYVARAKTDPPKAKTDQSEKVKTYLKENATRQVFVLLVPADEI